MRGVMSKEQSYKLTVHRDAVEKEVAKYREKVPAGMKVSEAYEADILRSQPHRLFLLVRRASSRGIRVRYITYICGGTGRGLGSDSASSANSSNMNKRPDS